MRVLVACEESQRVCLAFRKRGFEAYSCDIQDCSGGHPECHIKQDVLSLLKTPCEFYTVDRDGMGVSWHYISNWDLIIAHPPCTYLSIAGNSWFNIEKYGEKAKQRCIEREKAMDFFMLFINANCEHIAVENPVGTVPRFYRKPDQIIQPYWFGNPERKATCLWLKNLPKLKPTNMVEPNLIYLKNGRTETHWHFDTLKLSTEERRRARSKTFQGIADAMAEQWGDYLNDD